MIGLKETPKLAAALLKAQIAVNHVPPDKRNSFSNYDYASAESIITEARRVLNDAGIVCPMVRCELSSLPGMGEGELDGLKVEVTFAVAHESGESIVAPVSFPAFPRKGTPIDKATAAALTTAESYFLRSLLLIPRCAKTDDIAGADDAAYTPTKGSRKKGTGEASVEQLKALGEFFQENKVPAAEVEKKSAELFGRKVRDLTLEEIDRLKGEIVK